jgi:hypothetical protein
MDDPRRPKLLSAKLAPTCAKEYIDSTEANRANDLSEIELPKFKTPQTDKEEPKRTLPNSDKLAPLRAKDRKAKEEPMLATSSTDKVFGRRENPRNDNELPKCA